MTIRKLLIANRGEIAVRVIRTAREMGIATVAVFSDADRESLHVKLADEAVHIGDSEASKSYLSIEAILDAARKTSADAIHPGYGFLSERDEFADACEAAGIIFVGPSADAMRKLGDKIAAKSLAVMANVPIVPGFFHADATAAELEAAALEIGYPIMLKASAGGGGRGMRIVREPSDFAASLAVASDEALKSFGDGTMMVEKLVVRPRHVEVQVLADAHGNVACLFERECSIQRRHQKLLEEAPSPLLTRDDSPIAWADMAGAASRIVKAAGYTGAGTVEFIVDEAAGKFYFLEVNARLQVEHPVTEAITGLDLVRWQLRIAQGERLELPLLLGSGDRTAISGVAIEARIIAEDPGKSFLPSIGKIVGWAEPKIPGVRVDTGFYSGSEIPQHYDSLLAKVIAHGGSREEALEKLEGALLDFHILGVKTNIEFLLEVVRHPEFRSGDIDTGFLGRHFEGWTPQPVPPEIGALSELAGFGVAAVGTTVRSANGVWDLADGFRNVRREGPFRADIRS